MAVCYPASVRDVGSHLYRGCAGVPVKCLYISGPMTGYPSYNHGAFYSAATSLKRCGYTVVNPAELRGSGRGEMTWAEYLRRDLIAMLGHSDGVATLSGWHNSPGAMLETDVAVRLGMKTQSVALWIEESS